MLSKISIRAKITTVVAVLLVALAGAGVLAVMKMRAINASTVDITTNWLPSIRVLGDLRAGVITYRNVIREHMLAETLAQAHALLRRAETPSFPDDAVAVGFVHAVRAQAPGASLMLLRVPTNRFMEPILSVIGRLTHGSPFNEQQASHDQR